MVASVVRDGDVVRLDGVRGWSFAERQSSAHAAQEAIMAAVGEEIDYPRLIGTSGLAFRLQLFEGGFCPSSPHPCCGYDCVGSALAALPWAATSYMIPAHAAAVPWPVSIVAVDPEDGRAVSEARAAVAASIDRGVPVQYGSEEDGVVVGYGEGGALWLALHPWHAGGSEPYEERDWPWGIMVFTDPKADRPSWTTAGIAALDRAVEMAHRSECGHYHLGFAAWERIIEELEGRLLRAGPEERREAQMGNAWIFECLVHHRRNAVHFLRALAGEVPAAAAGHLRDAAGRYEAVVDTLAGDRCTTEIAPYPADGVDWTDEAIVGEVARLREALAVEREAVAAIESARRSLGRTEAAAVVPQWG